MARRASPSDLLGNVAVLVDRILEGRKPGESPIQQTTVFEQLVNLETARALDLKFPQSIFLRADRVTEWQGVANG